MRQSTIDKGQANGGTSSATRTLATHPSVESDTAILEALAIYQRDKASHDYEAARNIAAEADADAAATAANATVGLGVANEKKNATTRLDQQGTPNPAAQHPSAGNKATKVASNDNPKEKEISSKKKDSSRKNEKDKKEIAKTKQTQEKQP